MNIVTGKQPSEFWFRDPVVYLLGKISGFKPYVGVSSDKILKDAIRLVGIDPDTSPWSLEPTDKEEGLYSLVQAAWLHQTREYLADARCARPIDGDREHWALTAVGVAQAKELTSRFDGQLRQLSSGPNPTAKWIGDRYELLCNRISKHLHRKMPRSAEFGKIDDHIHDFFASKIANDGFRKAIESGRNLPPSTIALFARRSAYSDIRDEGREPVCRIFHGSLTKNEIEEHESANWTEVVMPTTINTSEFLQVNTYTEHSEEDQPADPMDFLVSPTTIGSAVDDADAMEKVLDLLSEIIHAEISEKHNPDWHEQIMIDKFIHGMSIREIAESRGLDYDSDRNKIMLALSRVRKAVTRRRDLGHLSEFLTH